MPDQLVHRVRVASDGWPGGPGLNSFYFLHAGAAEDDSSADALDVATRVHDALDAMSAIFPTVWNATVNPEIDVINTDNGDLVASDTVEPPDVVDGTGTVGFGPQVAMICASLLTGDLIDGRKVRGRTFIGPTIVSDDTDGSPLTDVLDIVQDALAALVGGTLDHPVQQVWSRRRGVSVAHPTGLGGSAHDVSAVTVKDQYAVLRSRRS